MGPPALLSMRRKIFIALKNSSPRLGVNPRPLGPVASTLTTTTPRRHSREEDSVEWSHLVQDRNWLQAFVNTVMNLLLP
jgi:hypothetical protein